MLTTSQAFGQGSSIHFSAGYGFPIGNTVMETKSYLVQSTFLGPVNSSTGYKENTFGTSAAGLTLNAGYSRRFTQRIGVEIDLQYLFGNTYTSFNKYSSLDINNYISSFSDVTSGYVRGAFINPSLLWYFPLRQLQLYGKFGFVMGSSKSFTSNQVDYDSPNPATTPFHTTSNWEITSEWSYGFKFGIGALIPIVGKWSLKGEINLTAMSFYPDTGENTERTLNGTNSLPTNASAIRRVYKTKISTSSSNPNEPAQVLQMPTPMSSFAFQMGISYKLK